MAIYEYYCEAHEHYIDQSYPMGEAPGHIVCKLHDGEHGSIAMRYFGNARFTTVDEYRQAYLSSTKSNGDEWAPTCKEDVKLIREKTGRNYFGRDWSNVNMTPEMREKFKDEL